MTYGQRRRAEERKLERANAKAQAWYESLTEQARKDFDERARIAREQLLASREN